MAVSASLLAANVALRAASLDLCADEYLLFLARPTEIVSVSRLAHDRADSPLWRTARRFRANDGGIESVLGQRPSLLLTSRAGGRATAMIAARLRIRTVKLPTPTSIEEVEATMVRVAGELGDVHRADPWRRRLARLRLRTLPRRDAIFVSGGGFSIAPGSLGAQWMSLAGLQQRRLPGGRASLELLVTRPPEILLRSTYRRTQQSLGQRWLKHPLANRSTSKTVDTDGRPWLCMGPLMVLEIERLRAIR